MITSLEMMGLIINRIIISVTGNLSQMIVVMVIILRQSCSGSPEAGTRRGPLWLILFYNWPTFVTCWDQHRSIWICNIAIEGICTS